MKQLALLHHYFVALLCIALGCHRSLKSVAPKSRLEGKQAALLPITGSLVLCSLFFVFRYFDKSTVNALFAVYFQIFSAAAVFTFFAPAFKSWYPPAFLMSAVLVSYYLTQHFVLNNILAVCLATVAIETLQLSSFRTAAIVLSGLFLYDIFWVFGTTVMVTVALSFKGPIKIEFPADIFNSTPNENGIVPMSILGLGDIVVPGVVIALLLQFDADRALQGNQASTKTVRIRTRYFSSGIFAYCIGLAASMIISLATRSGQPALLYLSPACLLVPLILAMFRGEFFSLLMFETQEEAEPASSSGLQMPLPWHLWVLDAIGFPVDTEKENLAAKDSNESSTVKQSHATQPAARGRAVTRREID